MFIIDLHISTFIVLYAVIVLIAFICTRKILDYYRASKGAFLCIKKRPRHRSEYSQQQREGGDNRCLEK